jgi:4-hydroxy-tetrahydrodipicolinate synthase
VISVTANIVPKAMAELTAAALRGERERATRLDAPLRALHDALFVESNPIPVKWAMAQRGLIQGGLRLPMTELSEPYRGRVRAALEAAEGLESYAQAKSA